MCDLSKLYFSSQKTNQAPYYPTCYSYEGKCEYEHTCHKAVKEYKHNKLGLSTYAKTSTVIYFDAVECVYGWFHST